ncbi:uncharacterized protein LOC113371254 [Ctenocephalides felis]|uniref:uncharacterized protein LOC113371254 n=1 Tax=Ctenocephalides felis TaxID=7515 RepID=UPI000E6E18CA|nr:uncharacterized protein LOC113371254 [Ctenocephalides felis]
MAELRAMAAAIMGNSLVENVADKNLLAELKSLCSTLIFENIVDVLVVTLGDKGVAIARLCDNSERLFDDSGVYIKPGHKTDKKISVRLYPPAQLPANSLLANTSGAGDCFAAGFAVAAMLGVTLNGAVAAGNTTAIRALLSNIPVPDKLFLLTKQNWTSEATYKEL